MIETHHMKDITVHPSFRPVGVPLKETYEQGLSFNHPRRRRILSSTLQR